MIVPHARCGGYGWVYVWFWNPHTHVPSRRKWRCGPCRSTGYMTIKPPLQRPLPDAARAEAALRKRGAWKPDSELKTVRVSMRDAPGCTSVRLGLFGGSGGLVALIRETRVGAICLDAPSIWCTYTTQEDYESGRKG